MVTKTLESQALAAPPIIADRGEFVDALALMRRGHPLLRCVAGTEICTVGGAPLLHTFSVLHRYGLIDEVGRPSFAPHVQCFLLSERGRSVADQAVAAWRRQPLWQRLLVRLTG